MSQSWTGTPANAPKTAPQGALTPNDHRMLAERIRTAEATTRGEIYCVVARSSGRYVFPPAFMLATGVLVASVAVALWLDRSWFTISHLGFVLCQLAALAAALLVLRLAPGIGIRFAPRWLRYRRAHDNAVRQFLAHNVHLTEKRTGILIFVSLAERYATVIADAGIDDKVAQGEWDAIVARIIAAAKAGRLTEGLADGIDKAGALLTQHFPGGTRNPNELDDHVVEI